eukprot:TRINITY_DN25830_c0_g2_i1.p1 TRINITY_DN25830_c0_g2~~TRINITY_DN25830_c0_g2_i1.p1  ORF type:complete len:826 (+),score=189.40 TRINITY_DN25830_c0_g2_i1:133-2610(+)
MDCELQRLRRELRGASEEIRAAEVRLEGHRREAAELPMAADAAPAPRTPKQRSLVANRTKSPPGCSRPLEEEQEDDRSRIVRECEERLLRAQAEVALCDRQLRNLSCPFADADAEAYAGDSSKALADALTGGTFAGLSALPVEDVCGRPEVLQDQPPLEYCIATPQQHRTPSREEFVGTADLQALLEQRDRRIEALEALVMRRLPLPLSPRDHGALSAEAQQSIADAEAEAAEAEADGGLSRQLARDVAGLLHELAAHDRDSSRPGGSCGPLLRRLVATIPAAISAGDGAGTAGAASTGLTVPGASPGTTRSGSGGSCSKSSPSCTPASLTRPAAPALQQRACGSFVLKTTEEEARGQALATYVPGEEDAVGGAGTPVARRRSGEAEVDFASSHPCHKDLRTPPSLCSETTTPPALPHTTTESSASTPQGGYASTAAVVPPVAEPAGLLLGGVAADAAAATAAAVQRAADAAAAAGLVGQAPRSSPAPLAPPASLSPWAEAAAGAAASSAGTDVEEIARRASCRRERVTQCMRRQLEELERLVARSSWLDARATGAPAAACGGGSSSSAAPSARSSGGIGAALPTAAGGCCTAPAPMAVPVNRLPRVLSAARMAPTLQCFGAAPLLQVPPAPAAAAGALVAPTAAPAAAGAAASWWMLPATAGRALPGTGGVYQTRSVAPPSVAAPPGGSGSLQAVPAGSVRVARSLSPVRGRSADPSSRAVRGGGAPAQLRPAPGPGVRRQFSAPRLQSPAASSPVLVACRPPALAAPASVDAAAGAHPSATPPALPRAAPMPAGASACWEPLAIRPLPQAVAVPLPSPSAVCS